MTRRAVIDIGTNTVKLLVADVDGARITPVLSRDAATRLGQGLNVAAPGGSETGPRTLCEPAVARTLRAVREFAAEARRLGGAELVAVATSATRDAANADEFVRRVRQECGVDARVISGAREAELIFLGVCSDPRLAGEAVLVLDVGGGSAELIQGRSGRMQRHRSLPLGAVRLTERFADRPLAAMTAHARAVFSDALAGFDPRGRRMIGTGGGIATLARMKEGRADHVVLSRDHIRAELGRLAAMSLEERKTLPGLPPERADIIVAGGTVFAVAMDLLEASELTVSVRGLRYGLLAAGP
jgi:exopolyphosphatase/guanosine-5'-triphosphate,3'-diphosphate pyrophosphatase